MNPVFLQCLTLSVHLDLVIYPTQATKQVRLLFRSHRILTCNGYFKGAKFANCDTLWKHEINRRSPPLRRKGVFGSLPSLFDNLLCSFTLMFYGHCLFSEISEIEVVD